MNDSALSASLSLASCSPQEQLNIGEGHILSSGEHSMNSDSEDTETLAVRVPTANVVKIMFKHFLVPLDGSPLAECVLPHTIAFARGFQAQVTLLRVLASPPAGTPVDAFTWQMDMAAAQAYVDGVAVRLQAAGVPTDTVVMAGQPTNIVTDYVHSQQVDLVILSSHGESGVADSNMGSIVQNILLRSGVSGLLVRADPSCQTEQTDLRYQRLLVPLDGSLRARHVLPFVTPLARLYDSRLLLVHVLRKLEMPRHIPLSPEHQALRDQLSVHNYEAVTKHFAQLASQLPDATEFRVLEHEDVAACLHEVAKGEGVDLVILSAHGYSGGSQWPYGSIAINLIANGETPLLLVQDWPVDWLPTPVESAAGEDSSHQNMAIGRLPTARPYNWLTAT
jgi:nucleotide-binding universal stress UspA family protein